MNIHTLLVLLDTSSYEAQRIIGSNPFARIEDEGTSEEERKNDSEERTQFIRSGILWNTILKSFHTNETQAHTILFKDTRREDLISFLSTLGGKGDGEFCGKKIEPNDLSIVVFDCHGKRQKIDIGGKFIVKQIEESEKFEQRSIQLIDKDTGIHRSPNATDSFCIRKNHLGVCEKNVFLSRQDIKRLRESLQKAEDKEERVYFFAIDETERNIDVVRYKRILIPRFNNDSDEYVKVISCDFPQEGFNDEEQFVHIEYVGDCSSFILRKSSLQEVSSIGDDRFDSFDLNMILQDTTTRMLLIFDNCHSGKFGSEVRSKGSSFYCITGSEFDKLVWHDSAQPSMLSTAMYNILFAPITKKRIAESIMYNDLQRRILEEHSTLLRNYTGPRPYEDFAPQFHIGNRGKDEYFLTHKIPLKGADL